MLSAAVVAGEGVLLVTAVLVAVVVVALWLALQHLYLAQPKP
jgi:hypothetical protein